MCILHLLEVLKTPSERALIWSAATAVQWFVLLLLRILFLHFNRSEHLSDEIRLCFFFESEVPLFHIHIALFRDSVYLSIVVSSCFVIFSYEIMKTM